MQNKPILTDFHSHILPGADHGSTCDEVSKEQLELLNSVKIGRVVATPHFYPNEHNIDSFLKRRDAAEARLKKINDNSDISVLIGAEVLVCERLEAMPGLEKLCVKGTKTILLEMPMTRWSSGLLETVDEIFRGDMIPVMAHIDRYPPKDVDALFEIGVKAQLNVGSVCRVFGKSNIKRWVESGQVVALGTDLHGPDKRACANFVKACGILGDHIDQIMAETDKLLAKIQ